MAPWNDNFCNSKIYYSFSQQEKTIKFLPFFRSTKNILRCICVSAYTLTHTHRKYEVSMLGKKKLPSLFNEWLSLLQSIFQQGKYRRIYGFHTATVSARVRLEVIARKHSWRLSNTMQCTVTIPWIRSLVFCMHCSMLICRMIRARVWGASPFANVCYFDFLSWIIFCSSVSFFQLRCFDIVCISSGARIGAVYR